MLPSGVVVLFHCGNTSLLAKWEEGTQHASRERGWVGVNRGVAGEGVHEGLSEGAQVLERRVCARWYLPSWWMRICNGVRRPFKNTSTSFPK